MSRFELSSAIWGSIFAAVAVVELLPVFWAGCPWTTLSTEAKGLEIRWVWAALIFLIGLTILNIHIVGAFLPKLYRQITG